MICHHKMQWFYWPLFFREYKIGKIEKKKTLKFPAKLSFCCGLFPRLVIWGGFGRTFFVWLVVAPPYPSPLLELVLITKRTPKETLAAKQKS